MEKKEKKKSKSVAKELKDKKNKIARKMGLGPKELNFIYEKGAQTFPT